MLSKLEEKRLVNAMQTNGPQTKYRCCSVWCHWQGLNASSWTIFSTIIIQDVDDLLRAEMTSMLFGIKVINLQSPLR